MRLYVICYISNKQYRFGHNKCFIEFIVKSNEIVFSCNYKWIVIQFFIKVLTIYPSLKFIFIQNQNNYRKMIFLMCVDNIETKNIKCL